MDDRTPLGGPEDAAAHRNLNEVSLRDRADIEVAVGWLIERYTMNDLFARVLLGQLARQDSVTEASAARSLIHTNEPDDHHAGLLAADASLEGVPDSRGLAG